MITHCLFNKNTPLPTRLYTHLGGLCIHVWRLVHTFHVVGVHQLRRRCTPTHPIDVHR